MNIDVEIDELDFIFITLFGKGHVYYMLMQAHI